MSQTYVYSIAADTLNGKLNASTLAQAIIDGSFPSGGAFEGAEAKGGSYASGVITGGNLEITWQSTLDGTDESAQDALVAAHAGDPFGASWQSAEDDTVSSTGLDTPQTKLSLTPPDLSPGSWLVTTYCEIRLQSPSAGSGVLATATAAGSPVAEDNWDADVWHAFSAAVPLSVDAGATPAIDLTFQRTGNAATVEIRRARIELAASG